MLMAVLNPLLFRFFMTVALWKCCPLCISSCLYCHKTNLQLIFLPVNCKAPLSLCMCSEPHLSRITVHMYIRHTTMNEQCMSVHVQ